jgi:6-phosphogluconolactonase
MTSESNAPDSRCGWMIKRCVYRDTAAVAAALAHDLLTIAETPTDHPIALMLAGGRTPKAAYTWLAASGRILPATVTLALSDDRYVPAEHPDSNRLLLRPMLTALQCPPERQLMVDTTLEREAAALDFGRQWEAFFARGGRLHTAYLGLGADGHTASLFTPEHLRLAEGRGAIDVDRPDGRVGISAAPSIIRRAARIVFVVTGADKHAMAAALTRDPSSIIAGQVIDRHPHVELWLDSEAA